MTQQRRIARPFTGKHMAAIMIAFFGVVIAVNVLMARLASSTFGGLVVENSYVASQKFNGWLDEARSEKALGWNAAMTRSAPDALQVTLADAQGRAITGASLTAVAEHPLGLRDDEQLNFREVAPGRYAARLTPGRWQVKLAAKAQGRTWRTIGDVQ